jgi:hypothetical protein
MEKNKMDILKELEIVEWDSLRTAQGINADYIPKALLGLMSVNKEEKEIAYWSLENHVVLQGDVYDSSYYIIPFLVEMIEKTDEETKVYAYDLLIEIINGYSVYDVEILHNEKALELREANYQNISENLDIYLDDLEFIGNHKNEKLMTNTLYLLSSFRDKKEKIIPRLQELYKDFLFQDKIDEAIDYLNITEEELEELDKKSKIKYQESGQAEIIAKINERSVPKKGVSDEEFRRIAYNVDKILTYEIKKGEGLGDIYFGMSEKDFIKKYVSYKLIDENIIEIEDLYNDTRIYNFFNSIRISINIYKGVTSIILQNNFQGKYKNIIGIKSTYSEIKNALIKINEYGGYYEDYLLVRDKIRDKNNFLIAFDFKSVDPDETEILEDWMEWKKDRGEEIIKDCKVDYIVINAKK